MEKNLYKAGEENWKNRYTKAFLLSLRDELLHPFPQMPPAVRQVLMASVNLHLEEALREVAIWQDLQRVISHKDHNRRSLN